MKEKKPPIKTLMLVRRRVNKNDCNENDTAQEVNKRNRSVKNWFYCQNLKKAFKIQHYHQAID